MTPGNRGGVLAGIEAVQDEYRKSEMNSIRCDGPAFKDRGQAPVTKTHEDMCI